MVTVDLVVFAIEQEGLRALFIKRARPPFEGQWAIPGGYLDLDEPIEAAARRELVEETGLSEVPQIEVIGVFGEPGRDPRGRTISIAHGAVLPGNPPAVQPGDDAGEALWIDPRKVQNLAFDHAQILERGRQWLTRGITERDFALRMLPGEFTENDLRQVLRATVGSTKRMTTFLRRWIKTNRVELSEGPPRAFRVVGSKNLG